MRKRRDDVPKVRPDPVARCDNSTDLKMLKEDVLEQKGHTLS
jgi:hypothetical protein